MFETLDTIDWESLSHVYGSSRDAPKFLRTLASSSRQHHAAALTYFWENFVDQGSLSEAGPYAIPFLFEILEQSSSDIQRDLIDLLWALAVGHSDDLLPCGHDIRAELEQYDDAGHSRIFYSLGAKNSYLEGAKRAHRFLEFASPGYKSDVRTSAIYALAHFAQALKGRHVEIADILSGETEPLQQTNLLLCFGLFARHADSAVETDFVKSYLSESNTPMVRLAAAIALMTIHEADVPELALQTIFTALTETWKFDIPERYWTWWNEGDLLGYAAMVLTLVGPGRRNEILAALCTAIEQVESTTYALPLALLDIAFPDHTPGKWRQVADFDAVQRIALGSLIRSGHWTSWMIDGRFLPEELTGDEFENALQNFLKSVTSEDSQFSSEELFRRMGNVSSWDHEKRV